MLTTEQQRIQVSAFNTSAEVAEVHAIKPLVEIHVAPDSPERLLYVKATNADWLRKALAHRRIDQITPYRRNRKKTELQDDLSLRRYKHRWQIEGTISWLANYRRFLVRDEYYAHLFEGFLPL